MSFGVFIYLACQAPGWVRLARRQERGPTREREKQAGHKRAEGENRKGRKGGRKPAAEQMFSARGKGRKRGKGAFDQVAGTKAKTKPNGGRPGETGQPAKGPIESKHFAGRLPPRAHALWFRVDRSFQRALRNWVKRKVMASRAPLPTTEFFGYLETHTPRDRDPCWRCGRDVEDEKDSSDVNPRAKGDARRRKRKERATTKEHCGCALMDWKGGRFGNRGERTSSGNSFGSSDGLAAVCVIERASSPSPVAKGPKPRWSFGCLTACFGRPQSDDTQEFLGEGWHDLSFDLLLKIFHVLTQNICDGRRDYNSARSLVLINKHWNEAFHLIEYLAPKVNIPGKHLEGLTQLFPRTTAIVLSDVQDDAAEAIQESGVQRVKIHSRFITSHGFQCLTKIKSLKWLELIVWRHAICDHGLMALSHVTSLTHLDLRNCSNVTDEGLKSLECLTSLTHFHLAYPCITDQGLWRLANFPLLRHLGLTHCDRIVGDGLGVLASLTLLTHLDLRGSKITDERLILLAPLTSLSHLDLSHSRWITGTGLGVLLSLSGLRNLKLNGCMNINDDGLKMLGRLVSLEHLELKDCVNTTDTGLKALSCLTSLVHLDLTGWRGITDEGICYLGMLTNLAHLNLCDCCNITDKGLKALGPLQFLAHVRLTCCTAMSGTCGPLCNFFSPKLTTLNRGEMRLWQIMGSCFSSHDK